VKTGYFVAPDLFKTLFLGEAFFLVVFALVAFFLLWCLWASSKSRLSAFEALVIALAVLFEGLEILRLSRAIDIAVLTTV